jgi:YD repeat-containing protein
VDVFYDVAATVHTSDPEEGAEILPQYARLNLRTQIEYSQPGHPTITVTQTFDAVGHRIGMTDSTGTHSYAYDDGGNLTSAFNPSGDFTYDYSHPGKMIETYPDGTKETYAFDDAHDVMSVDSSTGVQVSYIRNAARRVTGSRTATASSRPRASPRPA